MPSARGLLATSAGLIAAFSGPAIGVGISSGPIIAPIISAAFVGVTAIGTAIIYIKDRRASRRSIEKSTFGKVLNRNERKTLKPQYKAAKARAKADAKVEKAALKAEEKLRAKELRKVTTDELKKKIRGLPLKVALAGVKFVTVLAAEIPLVMAEADAVMQGVVQPIPNVPEPDLLPGNRQIGNAVRNTVTSPTGAIGEAGGAVAPVAATPANAPAAVGNLTSPVTNTAPVGSFTSSITNAAGSTTPMPVTPI
ncbi:hypothetical protein ABW19_dt0208923 [Dactylella cylindrospora]|nr:hypothetical protein ABW19_dt0208923 [Dactylella cylindrospora]